MSKTNLSIVDGESHPGMGNFVVVAEITYAKDYVFHNPQACERHKNKLRVFNLNPKLKWDQSFILNTFL